MALTLSATFRVYCIVHRWRIRSIVLTLIAALSALNAPLLQIDYVYTLTTSCNLYWKHLVHPVYEGTSCILYLRPLEFPPFVIFCATFIALQQFFVHPSIYLKKIEDFWPYLTFFKTSLIRQEKLYLLMAIGILCFIYLVFHLAGCMTYCMHSSGDHFSTTFDFWRSS